MNDHDGETVERTRSTVAAAMLTDVKISRASATVGEVRALFASARVHSAVLVADGRLVGVLDRDDLPPAADDEPAAAFATLRERVVRAGADLTGAREALLRTGRRRLAVVDADGRVLGLLCLKRTRQGFCSNRDVRARAQASA